MSLDGRGSFSRQRCERRELRCGVCHCTGHDEGVPPPITVPRTRAVTRSAAVLHASDGVVRGQRGFHRVRRYYRPERPARGARQRRSVRARRSACPLVCDPTARTEPPRDPRAGDWPTRHMSLGPRWPRNRYPWSRAGRGGCTTRARVTDLAADRTERWPVLRGTDHHPSFVIVLAFSFLSRVSCSSLGP